MVYHVITTEKNHNHKEICPNLSLEELKICLDMFVLRTSVSNLTVIKTEKGLDLKEQKKLLKKY